MKTNSMVSQLRVFPIYIAGYLQTFGQSDEIHKDFQDYEVNWLPENISLLIGLISWGHTPVGEEVSHTNYPFLRLESHCCCLFLTTSGIYIAFSPSLHLFCTLPKDLEMIIKDANGMSHLYCSESVLISFDDCCPAHVSQPPNRCMGINIGCKRDPEMSPLPWY